MTRVERPASRSVRLVASAAIGAALFILPSVSPAQMPGATPFGQQDPVARDAVVNLKAYAEYKMGHYDNAREIWEGLAASGNTTALINLSNLFSQGGGVTADQKKAYGLR
jgi:TPR repeat protein